MEGPVRQQVVTLSGISQDRFLGALDGGLQHLAERQPSAVKQSCYTAKGGKGAEEDSVTAMCEVLTFIGRRGEATEEDVKKLLVSAGLQEDRALLLVAQRGRLVEMLSAWKQERVPSEELVDLQWRLGVVAGSSDKDEAGRTFVQVNFVSRNPSDAKGRSNRLVEMSLEKFYDFLHQLEKCRTSLEHSRHLL